MTKPIISSLNQLTPIFIQQYERYLPTAFDDSLSILQKINKVIKQLDKIGEITNDVVEQWNAVMEWVMGEGLEGSVNAKLEGWLADGTLSGLIDELLLGDKVDRAEFESLKKIIVNIDNFPRLTGETDDTLRIQRAVDYSSTFGGTLFLNRQTYYISGTIEQGTVEIDGHGATIIVAEACNIAFHSTGSLIKTISPSGITQNYSKGDRYLYVSDTSGIQVGDIIQTVSTELFHTSRAYWYKGGNFLVTKIFASEKLDLSHRFPFDLTASECTIKIYRPVTPKLKNIKIIRSGVMNESQDGVFYEYGKNVSLDNVFVGGFGRNIRLNRCVNNNIKLIETGEAYWSGAATGYGLSLYSCTQTLIENSVMPLGRHGFALSGQECAFSTTVLNCTVSNNIEAPTHAFDVHDNCYDLLVMNTDTTSIGVHGNVKFINCKFHNIVGDGRGVIKVRYGTSAEWTNYEFEGCEFSSDGYIDFKGDIWSQLPCEDANRIGSIVMRGCSGELKVNMDIKMTYQFTWTAGWHGVIDLLQVENHQKGMYFITDDNITKMFLKNMYYDVNNPFFNQYSNTATISRLILDNCGLPARYLTMNMKKFAFIHFIDCYLISVSGTDSGFTFTGGDAGNTSMLIFDNCKWDSPVLSRGVEFYNIGTLVLNNSPMAFVNGTTGAGVVKGIDV